jgi:hypothetical protein
MTTSGELAAGSGKGAQDVSMKTAGKVANAPRAANAAHGQPTTLSRGAPTLDKGPAPQAPGAHERSGWSQWWSQFSAWGRLKDPAGTPGEERRWVKATQYVLFALTIIGGLWAAINAVRGDVRRGPPVEPPNRDYLLPKHVPMQ